MTKMQKTVPAKVEKAPGEGRFRWTLSTGDIDRERDWINPNGWRLEEYRKNPVVMWCHDITIPPIARSADIAVQGGKLIAETEFPPRGIYPFADRIHDLTKGGFINSASVGFNADWKTHNTQRGGWDIHEQTLLEWSIVNVGALPQALIERRTGINSAAVVKWLDGTHVRRPSMSADRIAWDGDEARALVHEAVGSALRRTITRTIKNVISNVTGRLDYLDPDDDKEENVMANLNPLRGTDRIEIDLGRPSKREREPSQFDLDAWNAARVRTVLNALERTRLTYIEHKPGCTFRRIASPWIPAGMGPDLWPIELADEVERLLRRL